MTEEVTIDREPERSSGKDTEPLLEQATASSLTNTDADSDRLLRPLRSDNSFDTENPLLPAQSMNDTVQDRRSINEEDVVHGCCTWCPICILFRFIYRLWPTRPR